MNTTNENGVRIEQETMTMHLMMSLRGEPEHHPFLPQIAELGVGIELGSYGLVGIQSEQHWNDRVALHKAICEKFSGRIAVHGPFIGMEYHHIDHLIHAVVNRRLDMIYEVAVTLNACRVILHSGYTPTIDCFHLQNEWLTRNVTFWQREIGRWTDADIAIVLENETEASPDLLIQLTKEVNSPFLGICLDTGHQHLFSDMPLTEWVQRLGERLFHVHLHDNDRTGDTHWSLGRGTIDLDSFYAALLRHTPHVTLSLESVDTMEAKMEDLRKLATHFASHGGSYTRETCC